VTNTGGSTITGTLQLVFDNLTSGVTLANANGTTGAGSPTGAGDPFITTNTSLAPGQSVSFTVRFSNPSNGFIDYTPRVFVGSVSAAAASVQLQGRASSVLRPIRSIMLGRKR